MTVLILKADNARSRMATAWNLACGILQHGKAVRVKVEEAQPTRTLEQNDKFHAICNDVAKVKLWAGKKRDTEGWKRLFVDAWARATSKRQAEIVPSLDGESVVNLGIQTRRMPVDEMSELIEFAQCWCVTNEVRLNDGN